jgi:uncharacterized protein DUF3592
VGRHHWSIDLDGERHEVDLRLGYFSARREVLVDGRRVLDVIPAWNAISYWQMSTEYPLEIAGHPAAVRIRPGRIWYETDLVVDGRSVGTGREPEPLQPPKWYPRTTKRQGRRQGRASMVAGVVALLAVAFGLPGYYAVREARFLVDGSTTTGVITRHYQTLGRYGPNDRLQYVFGVTGRRYAGDQWVSHPLYINVADGATVPVEYLRSDATTSRVDNEIERRFIWLYGGLGVVVLSLVIVPFVLLRMRRRIESDLLQHGARTAGEVTWVERRVHGNIDQWAVGYRYTDHMGADRSSVATLSAGEPLRWTLGDRVQVVIDPDHPGRATLLT